MIESQLGEGPLFKRGKVRDIYREGERELLIVATDRISAFDRVMTRGVPGKGIALTKLSEFWFLKTRHIIPNHLIAVKNDRTLRVRFAERLPIEWIVRTYIYGSAWRAYSSGRHEVSGVHLPSGLQLAEELPDPILTPTTKNDEGHDEELTRDEAISQRIVNSDEWKELEEASYRLCDYYKTEASLKGIIIPDFKLEFGKIDDQLVQIDEPPTHDSARFWAKKFYKVGEKQEKHCLDKEFLRDYLMRQGFKGDGPVPELPDMLIDQISRRCSGAYEVLKGTREIDSLGLMSVDELLTSLQEEEAR
jgi:phosphoribosylaminoimidazole-succinocarboxamide synthase